MFLGSALRLERRKVDSRSIIASASAARPITTRLEIAFSVLNRKCGLSWKRSASMCASRSPACAASSSRWFSRSFRIADWKASNAVYMPAL